MTALLLVGAAATDPAHHEGRLALRSRGELRSRDAYQGPADLVVAELPPGARAVPPAVAELARETSARGILLWVSEPMVRPVTPVGAGNIVLAAAAHQGHTLSALDILLGAAATTPGQRQSLHHHWWCAWVAGAASPAVDVHLADSVGATFVHHHGRERPANAARTAAHVLGNAQTDARRASLLREQLGGEALTVHLTPGGTAWLVHWPTTAAPLWLYSPLRMPARWCLSAALATTGTPFVRVPAFAGDLMISASVENDAVPELLESLTRGPLEIYRTLERLAAAPSRWGVILEVR
ncbi:MAG: hypothetical protein R3B48_12345 [Kofleriaceae bacterium]